MQGNYNKIPTKTQDVEEKSVAEKYFHLSENQTDQAVSRYTAKKKATEYLAIIERDLRNFDKADRLDFCGTTLVFEKGEDAHRLVFGNFCRVRLCPMCQWRRSAKLQSQMFQITDLLAEKYSFIFLTLTVPNCNAEELRSTLSAMQAAWNRFRQLKQIKKIMRGYYRGIEVTHDIEPIISERRYRKYRDYYDLRGIKPGFNNPNYGKYHPHYHIVIAVNKSYFTCRDYLSDKVWRELWEQSYRASGTLQVDIRAVKPKRKGEEPTRTAVLEVTKYPVKDSEYLSGDLTEDTRTVGALEREVRDLRFVSLGGCFKEAHAELHLTDYDNPEEERNANDLDPSKLVAYIWRTGISAFQVDDPYVDRFIAYESERQGRK